jgi:hypothetical protein
VDWLAEEPTSKRVHRIQVRWSALSKDSEQPIIHLMKMNGRRSHRRYAPGEFDFIVGYCLMSDTAYVYSEAELSNHKKAVTAQPSAAERWDKLK